MSIFQLWFTTKKIFTYLATMVLEIDWYYNYIA
jgi:hypothetical protein